MAIRRYTMQDRSPIHFASEGPPTDVDLSLQQVYNMTDYTDEEFDHIASMEVGEEFFVCSTTYIKRTA